MFVHLLFPQISTTSGAGCMPPLGCVWLQLTAPDQWRRRPSTISCLLRLKSSARWSQDWSRLLVTSSKTQLSSVLSLCHLLCRRGFFSWPQGGYLSSEGHILTWPLPNRVVRGHSGALHMWFFLHCWGLVPGSHCQLIPPYILQASMKLHALC